MTSINKQNYQFSFTHRVILLFAGRLMPALVLVIISILYSRKLSYVDYGIYQSIWMYINIAAVVLSFGIPSVILSMEMLQIEAFLDRYKSKIVVFFTSLFLLLCTGVLQNEQIQLKTKFLASGLIITQAVITVFETILIKQTRDKALLYINVLYSLFFLIWHLYQLSNTFNINNLLIGLFLIQIIKSFILHRIIKRTEAVENISSEKVFISHWLYLGLNDVLGVLSKWIDKLIIIYFITPSEFALYFNGTYEIPFISLLVSVAGNLFVINIANNFNNKPKQTFIFSQGFIFLSKIVFPIFFFFLFFYTDCFHLLFGEKYNASQPFFLISLLILPVRINSYTSILQCTGKGKKIIMGSILDISLAIILMISLNYIWGLKGIALSAVIATYTQAAYYTYHSAKALKVSVFELIPIKKLAFSFFSYFSFLFILSSLLRTVDINQRLLIAFFTTGVLILIGILFYLKSNSFRQFKLKQ